MSSDTLYDVFERLSRAYGPQHWWPGENPFEIMVGAVLTQNTAWTNVEKAIDNLREVDALAFEAIVAMKDEQLAELIRPAGYYRVKTGRLKNLLQFITERYDGSLEIMFDGDVASLREGLLSVNGIGPETADSIILYAGNKLTFVVDTYTARIFKRHGWIEAEADYHAIKDFFEYSLEDDVSLWNEYHALLVQVGKNHCRAKPKCNECPLQDILPESGMMDLDQG